MKVMSFTSCSIFLHLLAVMCFHGSGVKEMPGEELIKFPMEVDALRLHSVGGSEKKEGEGHGMRDEMYATRKREDKGHMDHMDPRTIVFFTVKDLKVGKTMPIHFTRKNPASSPKILPQEVADTIPFSYAQLPHLLQHFSFSQGSPQAQAMEDTLRQCEYLPLKGETKGCATSLESMLYFVRNIFGRDHHFRALSTTYLTESSSLFQNYTILEEPKEIPAPRMVACHTMIYPYAVFFCHSQEGENKVFKVSLQGQKGDKVEAFSVCHFDTSAWSPDHVAFRLLGIKPGTSPVCHFFPADHLIWVPRQTLN